MLPWEQYAVRKKEVREATSFRRTVSLQRFPEQPNLEDEIYSKGGRFVTPWFSQLFRFFWFFSFLPLFWFLSTSLDFELEHISFPCSSAPCSQPLPKPFQ